MLKRFSRAVLRTFLNALRVFFILLMLVVPVPVGELFHRLLERGRRSEATQVKRD